MLFNSAQFVIFFPLVTLLYFLVPHRMRWALLLGASCVFYMAFIPAYILILVVTILIDYFAAIRIENCTGASKRRWLFVSVVSTCLVLFAFKYLDFFTSNLNGLARFFGWNYGLKTLAIILPIGLSFHTFQSLSYVVEVYRGHQKPERHFGIYSLYVMFYPQLVAGPIERPQNLLHQFREEHRFDYDRVTSGLKLMAWGLFKKAVIADRLALYANSVYAHPSEFSGLACVLATVAFAYQIYCDFSGYSDIAIGAARVMGFTLMTNFNAPYQSASIGEFWRRWHISLSTWFRDYVYIPLGGNRGSTGRWYLNLLVTFVVSGLWHGANWTFIIWGALNGVYLVLGAALRPIRCGLSRLLGVDEHTAGIHGLRVLFTFTLTCFAWVFFRAPTLRDAGHVISRIFHGGSGRLGVEGFSNTDLWIVCFSVLLLELVQLWKRRGPVQPRLQALPLPIRWPAYSAFLFLIIIFGVFQHTEFIYFQF
jgi:alginate O-acetyltransferase complex protein AlgI